MANQNRNEASKKARYAAKVSLVDGLGSNRSEFSTAEVFSVVENVAADFIIKVKESIQNNSSGLTVQTGDIEDIRLVTTPTSVDIVINNHLLFQSEGVRGRDDSSRAPASRFTYRNLMPPKNVFVNLIKNNQIRLRNEENYGGSSSPFSDIDGDDKAIDKAAFAIAKSIQSKGFKGHPEIYQDHIPQLVTDVQSAIANFTVNFLTQTIRNNDGTLSIIPIP